MPTLTDKTILVTGASQGLGEQVAKAYAAEGATVILVGKCRKQRAERRNRLPLNPEKAGIPPAPRFRFEKYPYLPRASVPHRQTP